MVVDETAEYLPMFLAEGREHLQELNLAVVRIEETPDDQATVDEIFRIAHSLKGMSATMGFAGMAALTHEMENVFELLRQRKGGLERAEIDVLLECLDALEAAVDAIESGGAEAITPDPLIVRLRRWSATTRPSDREVTSTRGGSSRRPTSARWPRAAASCRCWPRCADDAHPLGPRLHGPRRARRAGGDAGLPSRARRRRQLHGPRDRRLARERPHRRGAGRRRPPASPTSRTRRSPRPLPTRRRRPGGAPSAAAAPEARGGRAALCQPRAPRPSASTPSASTSSCTPWASSS